MTRDGVPVPNVMMLINLGKVVGGLKYPRVSLGDAISVKVAKAWAQVPGRVRVFADGIIVGEIEDDVAFPTLGREFTPAMRARIERAERDPAGRAVAHGLRTRCCPFCGQRMRAPDNVRRGYSVTCGKRYGFIVE